MVTNMPALFREYMVLERQRASSEGISASESQRWRQLKRLLNRHFQPDLPDETADQRDSVRVPARLRIGFETYGEIRECLMSNLSRGGVFIATSEPLPMGTVLTLWIRIEESDQEISLEGEVSSHNAGPGLLSEEIGMGIRFIRLSEEQEKAVENLYEHTLLRALDKS